MVRSTGKIQRMKGLQTTLREEIILEELPLVEYLTWRERERDGSNEKSHGRDEDLHEEGKSRG